MDPETLAQRIDAIRIVDSEPERPVGVDPAAVWRVPVGTIYVVDQAELAVVRLANNAHAESPGLLGMEDYLPEPEPEPLACPMCTNRAELTVQGRWGDPATLICPCGHQWPLAPDEPAWSARQLQHTICQSVAENGVPGA
ncbi:hypothetical protein ACIGW8_31465 [Streptomyces sioyaensis]|uniref:hypothetical protein n=1 Tax=Streptomyces sioyaensis TaxID=67364 RepID=UPI0037CF9E11